MSPIMRDPELPAEAQAALDAADQAMENAWMAYLITGMDTREGEKGGFHTIQRVGDPMQLLELGLNMIAVGLETFEKREGPGARSHYAAEVLRELGRTYAEALPRPDIAERDLRHAVIVGMAEEWNRLVRVVRTGGDLGPVLERTVVVILRALVEPNSRLSLLAYLADQETGEAPEDLPPLG